MLSTNSHKYLYVISQFMIIKMLFKTNFLKLDSIESLGLIDTLSVSWVDPLLCVLRDDLKNTPMTSRSPVGLHIHYTTATSMHTFTLSIRLMFILHYIATNFKMLMTSKQNNCDLKICKVYHKSYS